MGARKSKAKTSPINPCSTISPFCGFPFAKQFQNFPTFLQPFPFMNTFPGYSSALSCLGSNNRFCGSCPNGPMVPLAMPFSVAAPPLPQAMQFNNCCRF